MHRFASLLVVLIILTFTPQQSFAQVPNEPPAFDRSPPSGNTITTLDSTGSVGLYTSATIGADGFGLISYTDATNKDLKVAHCSDTACPSATLTTLDSVGNVGTFTSITIGQDGLGVIAYYDLSNANLKVAHCSNVECTAATLATLDSIGDVGKHTSITIGADGLALISYFDATNKDLKVAHCSDIVCSSATSIVADSAGTVGEYNSIALGRDARALISYYASSTGLKVARCADVACTSAATVQLTVENVINQYYPPSFATFTSIAAGDDGFPIISFYETFGTSVQILHCSSVDCSNGTLVTGDAPGNVGSYPSMTIGSNGLAVVSYYDTTQSGLKIGSCGTAQCVLQKPGSTAIDSAFTSVSTESAGSVGTYSSITIGTDGNPLVAYHDATNADLKVVHCSNPLCTPFFRRR